MAIYWQQLACRDFCYKAGHAKLQANNSAGGNMVLIGILAALFLALFILVPLMEKFGSKGEQAEQDYRKYSRWLLPLVALLLILQLIKMLFF